MARPPLARVRRVEIDVRIGVVANIQHPCPIRWYARCEGTESLTPVRFAEEDNRVDEIGQLGVLLRHIRGGDVCDLAGLPVVSECR